MRKILALAVLVLFAAAAGQTAPRKAVVLGTFPSLTAQVTVGIINQTDGVNVAVAAALPPAGGCTPGVNGHCATLVWTAPADATASSTYNVYRELTTCPGTAPTTTAGFTKINTAAITALTFTDATEQAGYSCYIATQVLNGLESAPSNDVQLAISPDSPTLSGTGQ